MLEKQREFYMPICDGCGAELPEEYSFADAVEAMKRQGWQSIPPEEKSGEWLHFCPACAALVAFNE